MPRKRQEQKARLASLLSAMRTQDWEPGHAAGWDEEAVERSYTALLRPRMTEEIRPLACVAAELLALHAPDTVRGNMYRVVSAGWLPVTSDKSYDCIQRLLKRLRVCGVIPFEWVVDNIRSTIKPSSWSGLADFAETAQGAYRKDFWAQLPEYVEVMVEKDAVAGVVSEVTREFDVRLHPIRGYNSLTFTPPKGEARLKQIIASAHAYGRHGYGNGLGAAPVTRRGQWITVGRGYR